jgi:peptide/nickel transport system substrate-binding protein
MAAMTRRDVLKLAAAGAAAAAPGLPRSAQAQTTQKRELIVAQGGDIAFLDPHLSTSSNDIRISFNIFDNLTSRRPDGKLAPGLATEWKLQGQTTWAFKLRPGVKWHNGDPFSSADVKFSIDRSLDTGLKGNRVNTVLTTVDRVETPDPGTVLIHTKKPDPLLPARLGFYGGQIIPKKYVEAAGPDKFNQAPVGTGPLRFVSWTKDDKIVLDANPDYWGGRVDFDRLVVRALPEMAPRVAALLKGEVDLITQVPPDQGERVKGNTGTTLAGALYGGLYVLAVNSKRPPLDNPLVKQALSLAVDREAIVKELWRGRGVVPNSMIAKGDNHFDASLPPLAFNPGEAKARLKKAGYKGEEIILETTAGYLAGDKPMAEAVQAMWRDVGVNAKVEVFEYSVRAQRIRDKSFKGLWWSDPTSTLRDPDGMMWRLLGPGGSQDYWRHPEFDELGNAARFSVDEKFRAGAYKRMTELFLENLPWIPVIQPYEDYGLQKYLEWTPDPLQQLEIRRFNFKFRRA